MAQEKVHAFWQSWFAMGWAMLQMAQRSWIAALQGARVPLIDTQAILARGLAPVHRQATANARRLARTPLRQERRYAVSTDARGAGAAIMVGWKPNGSKTS